MTKFSMWFLKECLYEMSGAVFEWSPSVPCNSIFRLSVKIWSEIEIFRPPVWATIKVNPKTLPLILWTVHRRRIPPNLVLFGFLGQRQSLPGDRKVIFRENEVWRFFLFKFIKKTFNLSKFEKVSSIKWHFQVPWCFLDQSAEFHSFSVIWSPWKSKNHKD